MHDFILLKSVLSSESQLKWGFGKNIKDFGFIKVYTQLVK